MADTENRPPPVAVAGFVSGVCLGSDTKFSAHRRNSGVAHKSANALHSSGDSHNTYKIQPHPHADRVLCLHGGSDNAFVVVQSSILRP